MTNNNFPVQPTDDDFVDLTPYVSALWHRRNFGLTLIVALFLLGFAISFTQPKMFTAEMIVAYAPNRDADSNAAVTGRLGALGALGNTLGLGGTGGKLQEDLATLRSNQFAKRFIENNKLAKHLTASSWRILSQKMETNSELYDESSNAFTERGRAVLEMNAHIRAFSKLIDIEEDKRSTLVTIKLRWWQRAKAQKLLITYIESLNNYLRETEINEAQRNIDYLLQQINATDIVELKKTFFNLIETQQKKIMLANTRPDYAFRVIDPPLKPFARSKPSRLLFGAAGGGLGLVIFLSWTVCTVLRNERITRAG